MNDTAPRIRPRAKWTAFSFLALWGYLLYGLGNATPYLRDDLRLTAFEAGLHASALALGVLVAGATADILGRRVGMSRLFDLSIAYFAVAVALHAAGVGQLQAAARATLGAGLAILIAPATLGLAGDAVGITAAWPIIMRMAACGLGVVALAHRIGRQTIAAG